MSKTTTILWEIVLWGVSIFLAQLIVPFQGMNFWRFLLFALIAGIFINRIKYYLSKALLFWNDRKA